MTIATARWRRPSSVSTVTSVGVAAATAYTYFSSKEHLVAEVQRWATSAPESGAAQLAVINPGGIRDDMLGLAASGYPAPVTYKQVAVVQSFAVAGDR